MACPGSVKLIDTLPPEDRDTTSVYAMEGTAAHELAAKYLRVGQDAVGSEFVPSNGVPVTAEMAEAVQVYLDHVRGIALAGTTPEDSRFAVEVRFSLKRLNPPVPMFGTADCVWYDSAAKTLYVFDYKHGQGVVVEAENNPQLAYYALGAALEFDVKPDRIVATIVQPRAHHELGPIRTWSLGWDDLVQFKEDLMAAAHATQDGTPTLEAGDHCRFCPAKAICPAQQETALAVVQEAFGPEPQVPAVTGLTDDEILYALDRASLVEDWFKELRFYVQRRLEGGEAVPGWGLKPKRATRRWADEEEAEAWLRAQGVLVRDILPRKLVSPAQAEKIVGSLPDDLVEAKSSGYNLVPAEKATLQIAPVVEAFTDDA